MHPEANNWVRDHATTSPVSVLDLGGRNVNGSIREWFPEATTWTALDIRDGDGVDIVADASEWVPDQEYDVVCSTELFEHTPVWREICATAYKACKAGGTLILTMAGPGRPAHSAIDGGPLRPGEYYGNVGPWQLKETLQSLGFRTVTVDYQPSPADVRAVATK